MYSTLKKTQEAIKNGVSVHTIAQYFLKKIDENADLNAFLEIFRDEVLVEAQRVDSKIAIGTQGKLAGMVIGIKDNICYANHKVSASSKILEGFESLFSATALERLIAEDAIVIGRLNCDEFAMGSSNENSAYGPVKNPINRNFVPGGSSGGSAAAVAAGLCTAALGSDTGGSIRQPASFTGTYGTKPSYGRISRHGLIAYASSFDQIGPLTNSLSDAALLTQIMAGGDEYDSTASHTEVGNYIPEKTTNKLKIAVLKECIENDGLDPTIATAFMNVLEALKKEGHEITMVSFPYMQYMVPTYYVLTTAEASSNLSRFDGVHFGHRSKEAVGVEETYKKSRTEGFGKEVKRRIMAGTFVLSTGYYDAYYSKGQQVRRVLRDKTNAIFETADIILTPTTPGSAFELNSVKDPITMYLQDIYTVHANLTGHPAISIPLGKTTNALPFGIQIMAKNLKEKEMFDAALVVEQTIK
jgi:aspartyl-tRNA(Asn)/glutamyl-tRNA(Gln) amidotransferase subunit A